MTKKKQTLAFATGKSGGHIVPCITLGEHIIQQYPQARLLFFAADTPLDRALLEKKSIFKSYFLKHHAWPGYAIERYPAFIFAFIGNFFMALHTLFYYKTDKVISTGELIAIPTCLAAKILGIPLELYELNVIPGKTIRFLSKIAQHVHCTFEETKLHFSKNRTSYTPYPARYNAQHIMPRSQACQKLGIDEQKKIIFVMGGSQGSLFINQTIKNWLNARPTNNQELAILHQTGNNDPFNWHTYYQEKNMSATIFSYNPNLALLYSAADLIICRSGAGTLFEALVFKKPILTIPLELPTNNHQLHNALAMAEKHRLVRVIRQHEIEFFPQEVEALLVPQ